MEARLIGGKRPRIEILIPPVYRGKRVILVKREIYEAILKKANKPRPVREGQLTAKYAIYYELDDAGKDTGRVQVVEETDDIVMDTFDTEKAAERAMVKMQAESDRNDKIETSYLEWEKACLACYKISKKELHEYLVNVVIL